VPDDIEVTPVVVLQKGASIRDMDRMRWVRDEVDKRCKRQVSPVEIYEVSILGDYERLT